MLFTPHKTVDGWLSLIEVINIQSRVLGRGVFLPLFETVANRLLFDFLMKINQHKFKIFN